MALRAQLYFDPEPSPPSSSPDDTTSKATTGQVCRALYQWGLRSGTGSALVAEGQPAVIEPALPTAIRRAGDDSTEKASLLVDLLLDDAFVQLLLDMFNGPIRDAREAATRGPPMYALQPALHPGH